MTDEQQRRLDKIRDDFRKALADCTERPGCPALLHRSTCAELRDLIRDPDDDPGPTSGGDTTKR